jgi:hypothetical protein
MVLDCVDAVGGRRLRARQTRESTPMSNEMTPSTPSRPASAIVAATPAVGPESKRRCASRSARAAGTHPPFDHHEERASIPTPARPAAASSRYSADDRSQAGVDDCGRPWVLLELARDL